MAWGLEMAGPDPAIPGFYGKAPAFGDFVRRRLPRSFLDDWDSWLQKSIFKSREQLSGAWLEDYLTSPLWRFVLSPGVCGEQATSGVLMPSVDAVGRYYPMTIAILLPEGSNPLAVADEGEAWFRGAEEIALYCLDDGFRMEEMETRLGDLGSPVRSSQGGDLSVGPSGAPAMNGSSMGGLAWRIEADQLGHLRSSVYPGVLDDILRARHDAYSLWWTNGSEKVASSLRIYQGLPPPEAFASFLREAGDAEDCG
jgi:type VI secretion system protein ImpM